MLHTNTYNCLLVALFIVLLPYMSISQQANITGGTTAFEAELVSFNEELLQNPSSIIALAGLAGIYATPSFYDYNPDTAYTFIRKAQSLHRKLKPSQQKKLAKDGLNASGLRKIQRDIREKGLEYHLASQTSKAMLFYMEHYKRLPPQLEERAEAAYLEFYATELLAQNNFDDIKKFIINNRRDIEEYLPHLFPKLNDALFSSYFTKRDSTQINNLFALLKEYPVLAPRIDAPMSQALARNPLITWAETKLRTTTYVHRMPKTIKVIYLYHFYTGEWSDLIGFQNRYPQYADSFNIRRAISVAKLAPDLSKGYTEDREDIYDNYIKLAAPVHKAYQALQQVIALHIKNKDWGQAIEIAEKYARYFGPEDRRITSLIEILKYEDEDIKPVSFSDEVNSKHGEYSPVISADGQQLYFCRNIEGNEEIFMSSLRDGEWSYPLAIESLNTEISHEAPLALSTDGTTLMMYDGGIVEYTDKSAEGWTQPLSFYPQNIAPVWQGVTTFSADRTVAIFAAKTIEVIGPRNDDNIDLYVAYKKDDGSWGPPINLGPTLNTPFEDRSPFLHPDMRTMYFSSSGHGGIGNLDVYMTTRIGDGWDKWTTPVNLGKEINSYAHDWGYRISTDGATAYFSIGTHNNREDIYQVEVPERFRPDPVSTISGLVTDLDGHPVNATLIIEDLTTDEKIKEIQTDPETGRYIITLPAGRLYSYTVKGEGLYPISNNIDLRTNEQGIAIQEQIKVPTLGQIQNGGLVLPLKNLFFDTDKYEIKSISHKELNRLTYLIKKYKLIVEIAGHTDNVGTPEYNRILSQSRADAARAYLIEKGISPEQIIATGYGMEQPVATNETEAGRAQNRRVEIRFQQQP